MPYNFENRPQMYDGIAICERLEAILDELQLIRQKLSEPKATHLSADDLYAMTHSIEVT